MGAIKVIAIENTGAASESADEAKDAIQSALQALDAATEAVNQAAGDSEHEQIVEALAAFKEATDKLTEIAELITKGQTAASEYAESLG